MVGIKSKQKYLLLHFFIFFIELVIGGQLKESSDMLEYIKQWREGEPTVYQDVWRVVVSFVVSVRAPKMGLELHLRLYSSVYKS